MNYLVGLGIATLSLFLAMDHLNQGADQFFDFVAFSIVWGGTLAVSVITLPWSQYRTLFSYFGKLLFHFGQKESHFVEHCLQRMSAHLQGDRGAVKGPDKFHHRILNEGFELIHLGFSSEKIEAILSERIHTFANQNESIANAIRSLAKYPPAFGLTGTVFGLVELMKGVSLGLSPQQTGYKMAIALVATLYGLLVSNLFINPAGEQIRKISLYEEKLSELALQTILLASRHTTLLEAQEMLNSMVSPENRVSILRDSELGVAS